jgi:hypothetical protein
MMTTTALVVTTLVIVLGIYDLVVVVVGGIRGKKINWSVSRFLQWLPSKSPFFILVIGYILGHVFGFMTCPDCSEEKSHPEVQTEPLPGEIHIQQRD